MTPTPNLPESVVTELLALSERATPGPWDVRIGRDESQFFVRAPRLERTHPYDIEILGEDDTLYPTRRADADFITALVNWFRSQDWRAANARAEGWLPIESAPQGEFLVSVHGKVFAACRVGDVIKAEYSNEPFLCAPTYWIAYPSSPAAQSVRSEASEGEGS